MTGHVTGQRGVAEMNLQGRAAKALRAAGYKPCPRWWLTDEQLDLVAYMARQNAEDVNKIRHAANRENQDD
jgi:hypothetical protein